MKKSVITLFLAAAVLLNVSGCASAGHQNAASGAAFGAVAGTVIGAASRTPLVGAVTGALVGGLIGNAVDQNEASVTGTSTEVVVRQAPVVIVDTPVIIDERIWVGNELWIYSYRGYRSPHGSIRYQSRVPFRRSIVRGEIIYRRR